MHGKHLRSQAQAREPSLIHDRAVRCRFCITAVKQFSSKETTNLSLKRRAPLTHLPAPVACQPRYWHLVGWEVELLHHIPHFRVERLLMSRKQSFKHLTTSWCSAAQHAWHSSFKLNYWRGQEKERSLIRPGEVTVTPHAC